MSRLLLAMTLTTLVTATTANAADKIYRWTDESGQTHFSAQPPADKRDSAQEYKPSYTRPTAGSQEYRINTENYRTQKAEAAAKKAEDVAAKQAVKPSLPKEEMEEQCRKAREYKLALSSNYSRRFLQEDGEYRPLTDEQRADKLEKADAMIKAYCQ